MSISQKFFETNVHYYPEYFERRDGQPVNIFNDIKDMNIGHLNVIKVNAKNELWELPKENIFVEDLQLERERRYFLEEGLTIDLIAYYKSYHYHRDEYGIYIKLTKFANLISEIMNFSNTPFSEARNFALQMILEHERFHFITELFATFGEIFHQDGLFDYYSRNYYRKTFSTPDCIEETLANYFSVSCHPEWNTTQIDFIEQFFRYQPDGYRQALNVSQSNELDYFYKLESQILNRVSNQNSSIISHYLMSSEPSSIIKNLILALPLSRFTTKGWLNIPIYIEMDTTEPDQFMGILKLVFPKLEFKYKRNSKVNHLNFFRYSAYDSYTVPHTTYINIDSDGRWESLDRNNIHKYGKFSRFDLNRIATYLRKSDFFGLDIHVSSTAPVTLEASVGNSSNQIELCKNNNETVESILNYIQRIIKV